MTAPRFRQRGQRPGDIPRRVEAPASRPLGESESELPLPMQSFTGEPKDDLAGRTRGDLTVIGCATGKPPNRSGAAWVVRCACGIYCLRRTKSIKKSAEWDACTACFGRPESSKT